MHKAHFITAKVETFSFTAGKKLAVTGLLQESLEASAKLRPEA